MPAPRWLWRCTLDTHDALYWLNMIPSRWEEATQIVSDHLNKVEGFAGGGVALRRRFWAMMPKLNDADVDWTSVARSVWQGSEG